MSGEERERERREGSRQKDRGQPAAASGAIAAAALRCLQRQGCLAIEGAEKRGRKNPVWSGEGTWDKTPGLLVIAEREPKNRERGAEGRERPRGKGGSP